MEHFRISRREITQFCACGTAFCKQNARTSDARPYGFSAFGAGRCRAPYFGHCEAQSAVAIPHSVAHATEFVIL